MCNVVCRGGRGGKTNVTSRCKNIFYRGAMASGRECTRARRPPGAKAPGRGCTLSKKCSWLGLPKITIVLAVSLLVSSSVAYLSLSHPDTIPVCCVAYNFPTRINPIYECCVAYNFPTRINPIHECCVAYNFPTRINPIVVCCVA